LFNIDYRNRTAEFGLLIGEPAARGHGFGTETTRLMLDYAFLALGVQSVMLAVWEFNHAGQRAYTKAGFRPCGRRRQSKFMGGKMWDTIYMDCLATEFVSPLLAQVLLPDD
jgi:RimJ/RimL family protein N-acetyltransferase